MLAIVIPMKTVLENSSVISRVVPQMPIIPCLDVQVLVSSHDVDKHAVISYLLLKSFFSVRIAISPSNLRRLPAQMDKI